MNTMGLLLLVGLPVAIIALLAWWLISSIRKAEQERQTTYAAQQAQSSPETKK